MEEVGEGRERGSWEEVWKEGRRMATYRRFRFLKQVQCCFLVDHLFEILVPHVALVVKIESLDEVKKLEVRPSRLTSDEPLQIMVDICRERI